MSAAQQFGRDYVEPRRDCGELFLALHKDGPDSATQFLQRLLRRALQHKLAIANYGHARAKFAHILDYVGGENHNHVAGKGAKQVEKAIALGGIETGWRVGHQKTRWGRAA